MRPFNPIATAQQHAHELEALELYRDPQLQATLRQVRAEWLELAHPSATMLRCFDWAFEEVMFGAVVWALLRRRLLAGRLLGLVGLLYGAGRFLLDFLRTREVVSGAGFFSKPDGRQLGLTFAQWFSLALLAWAVWVLVPRRGGGTKTA